MGKQAMQDGKYIAMTHKTCPICAKKVDEEILIHQRFKDISSVHNQSTGFSNPCEECQAGIDQGAIMIIVIDQDKTTGDGPENWWRTGNIFGIKQSAVEEMLAGTDILTDVLEKRVMIMDYKDAINVGLPVKYEP